MNDDHTTKKKKKTPPAVPGTPAPNDAASAGHDAPSPTTVGEHYFHGRIVADGSRQPCFDMLLEPADCGSCGRPIARGDAARLNLLDPGKLIGQSIEIQHADGRTWKAEQRHIPHEGEVIVEHESEILLVTKVDEHDDVLLVHVEEHPDAVRIQAGVAAAPDEETKQALLRLHGIVAATTIYQCMTCARAQILGEKDAPPVWENLPGGLAQHLFQIYGAEVGGVAADDRPIPKWEDIQLERVQRGWRRVADELLRLAEPRARRELDAAVQHHDFSGRLIENALGGDGEILDFEGSRFERFAEAIRRLRLRQLPDQDQVVGIAMDTTGKAHVKAVPPSGDISIAAELAVGAIWQLRPSTPERWDALLALQEHLRQAPGTQAKQDPASEAVIPILLAVVGLLFEHPDWDIESALGELRRILKPAIPPDQGMSTSTEAPELRPWEPLPAMQFLTTDGGAERRSAQGTPPDPGRIGDAPRRPRLKFDPRATAWDLTGLAPEPIRDAIDLPEKPAEVELTAEQEAVKLRELERERAEAELSKPDP